MNKVYRVIWSQAHQLYVAISEIAKGKSKTSRVKSSTFVATTPKFIQTLLTSALLLTIGQVWGIGYNVDGDDNSNTNDNSCFYDSTTQSFICGYSTTQVDYTGANPPKSVAVGKSAVGSAGNVVAIKNVSKVEDNGFIALDQKNITKRIAAIEPHQSIAIGYKARVDTVNSKKQNHSLIAIRCLVKASNLETFAIGPNTETAGV